MKLKSIFLILCLFIGAGFIQLSAQNFNPNGNSWWVEQSWGTSVYCDGEWVDYIYGVMKLHVVDFYKDDVWQKQIVQAHGEATSWVTGENFKYREKCDWYPLEMRSTWKYHLKGEDGSHYIGIVNWDAITGVSTLGDHKCF